MGRDKASSEFGRETCRTLQGWGGGVAGAGGWCHLDAGAGMYITPRSELVLYATEWHQSDHGNIRVVEFH